MAKHTLYLFPDTNLFIQCRPWEQLDWSEWAEFAEVHLIVCRPVQREIDNQKNRGNNRVAHRARKTYGTFRDILSAESGYKLLNDSGPEVKLYLEHPSLPSAELKEVLDYSKPDDELVGCLHRFTRERESEDARLLTHDVGPAMTAESHGLRVVFIKDEWILEPENSEEESENARLRERVAQLEKAEPKFSIKVVDEHGTEINSLSVEYTLYEPLTEDELSTYIGQITSRFPVTTYFGSREPDERKPSGIARLFTEKEIYTPASDEDISRYTNQEYPGWVESCEDILSRLHETLHREVAQPLFSIVAENCGNRPGTDALIEITGKGNLKICPPVTGDDDLANDTEAGLQLPRPPRSPRGQWAPSSTSIAGISALQFDAEATSRLIRNLRSFELPVAPAVLSSPRRNPNSFYYIPNRPDFPVDSFSLDCELWRHGIGEQYFDVEIFADGDAYDVRGAIECRVHASNLSSPAKKVIPVRVTKQTKSVAEHARALVDALVGSDK